MKKVVLATRNIGKISELSTLLAEFNLEVVGLEAFPQIGEIEETGNTFQENSYIKAKAVADALGLPAVADDSGLEVDALNGAPGVYSARYAGPDAEDAENNAKLLNELKKSGLQSSEMPAARFRCVMTAVDPGGAVLSAEGAWEGCITAEPAGDNGFGYDPIFFDPELGRTAAQLSKEEKNQRSHRGKALRELLTKDRNFWKCLAK